jgi:hypothetical protein
LLFDETTSFSAFLKMFNHSPKTTMEERDFAHTRTWTLRAPMLALSQPDPALAFPEGTVLHPQFFVHNTMAKPLDVTLRFAWRSAGGTGKAAGPSFRLGPFEAHQVDVAALQASQVLPKDAAWTSVILTTNGLPEEVVALAASYDKTLRYGAQTPFSDQLAFEWVGSLWEYDVQHNSLITAGNGGTKPIRAGFTIYYNGGTQKYELEQSLQPDEQMWIDVGKLIREQVPDKNGKLLPQDLTSGSYQLRDLSDKFIGSLYEGKVVYDKTFGHVTYGCAGCCAYSLTQLSFNPLGIPLLSTAATGVDAYNTCSSWWESVDESFYGHWSTASTAIATVDYYATHTGKAVGSTTSSTSGYLLHPTPRDCSNVLRTPQGSDNVASVKILLGGSGGTNITNTTQGVVIGQQIVLYGSYTLPSGASLTNVSWTIPGSTATPPTPVTAIFTFTNAGTGGPVPLTSPQLAAQSISFYWMAPNNPNVVVFKVNYTLNGVAQPAASASATFNVSGPTSVSLGLNAAGGPHILNNSTTNAQLEFGDPTATPGIQLTGNATSPPGTAGAYKWAQTIGSNNYSYTTGSTTTTCNGPSGLDNYFPLPITGNPYTDSPIRPLPNAYSQFKWTWDATVYWMWNPNSTNSIWVPIVEREWEFTTDVTQNLSTKVWTIQSDSSSLFGAQQIGYKPIQWSNVAANGSLGGCQ